MKSFIMSGKVTMFILAIGVCLATTNVDAGHRQCALNPPFATAIGNNTALGNGIGCCRPTPGLGMRFMGQNFIDADNNGICNYYEAGGGRGLGCRSGNFVDADNNGVCDYYETGDKPLTRGRECGRGCRP